MGKRLSPAEVGERRVIDFIDIANGRGEIVCYGRRFSVSYDFLHDLTEAVEMINLRLTGKLLMPKFRAPVAQPVKPQRLVCGGAQLYDGASGPVPVGVGPFYLLVEHQGERWDNWLGRLDELIKLLHIVQREIQGEPYVPRPAVLMPGHA